MVVFFFFNLRPKSEGGGTLAYSPPLLLLRPWRAFRAKSYTALNELLNGLKRESWSFGRLTLSNCWAELFEKHSYFSFHKFFPSHAGDCSVFCNHCVWWGKTKGFLLNVYSHETDHCLSCLLREPEQQKRFFLLVPVNKVIQFGPCWEESPIYLWLVMYWQLPSSD